MSGMYTAYHHVLAIEFYDVTRCRITQRPVVTTHVPGMIDIHGILAQ